VCSYARGGAARRGGGRTTVNLVLPMLLGGWWQGGGGSFLLGGGLHGVSLVVNRLWSASPLGQRLRRLGGWAGMTWRVVCVVLTFHCVCLAWGFFRLTGLAESLACVRQWFVFYPGKMLVGNAAVLSVCPVLGLDGRAVLLAHGLSRVPWASAGEGRPARRMLAWGFLWGLGVTVLLLAALLSPGGEKPPFIYFQF